MCELKERIKSAGMSQVDMVMALRERGLSVNPPELSNIIRGVYVYPKSKRVLEMCDVILSEREHA